MSHVPFAPLRLLAAGALLLLAGCAPKVSPPAVAPAPAPAPATPAVTATAAAAPITLSIVGTNDLHGGIVARNGRGGLALLGGYVANLRAARARDGGAVLLIDAGDMFQGTLESNLGEGAVGRRGLQRARLHAAAIGNHEFDFGPIGKAATPRSPTDDPRGALKARAAEARFPFLAANLIEAAERRPAALAQRAADDDGRCRRSQGRHRRRHDAAGVERDDRRQRRRAVGGAAGREHPDPRDRAASHGRARRRRRRARRRPLQRLRSRRRSVVVRRRRRDLRRRARAAARPGRRHRGRPHPRGDGPPGRRHRHHRGVFRRPRLRPGRSHRRSADPHRRRPSPLPAPRSVRARGPGDQGVRAGLRRGAGAGRVRGRRGAAGSRRRPPARAGAGGRPDPEGAAARRHAAGADPPPAAGLAARQPGDRRAAGSGARRGRVGEQLRWRPARRPAGRAR